MLYQVFYCLLVLSPALSRHMARYTELDDEDHQLLRAAYDKPSYRHVAHEKPSYGHAAYDTPSYGHAAYDTSSYGHAAYDTPSYDHEEYEEDDGKLDLMKDGLWALKAKIKELKAFDRALAAHMLSTKLKVKDLLENHMGEIVNHHHKKEKPYTYQAPTYQQPQYPAPAPQYGAQYAHDPYYGH